MSDYIRTLALLIAAGWAAIVMIWATMKLSDALIHKAQRELDQFADAFDASTYAKLVRDRFEPPLIPMERYAFPDDRNWEYIHIGQALLDVVSPECVDNIEELERSLYLEGLDIIEHGG